MYLTDMIAPSPLEAFSLSAPRHRVTRTVEATAEPLVTNAPKMGVLMRVVIPTRCRYAAPIDPEHMRANSTKRARLCDEAITDSVDGQEMARFDAISFKLKPKPAHVGIHCSGIGIAMIAPGGI